MMTDRLNDALKHLEEVCIHTRDDACMWVRFGNKMRHIIASDSSSDWPGMRGSDGDEQDAVVLVNKWRRAPPSLKAPILNALDLWLLRLRVEWNIEDGI